MSRVQRWPRLWILSAIAAVPLLEACERESGPTAPSVDDPSAVAADPTNPTPAPPTPKIAFWSNRDDPDKSEIYVMNASGTNEVSLTKGAGGEYPTWSPDGKKIAFVRKVYKFPYGWRYHLFVMNPDGSGVLDLSGLLKVTYGVPPVWSPDGSTIAFNVTNNNCCAEIWLVQRDGTGLVAVTNDGFSNVLGDWSSDGSKLVYARKTTDPANRTENRGIYVISRDGTGATQLTANAEDTRPAWSPAGNKIAFLRSPDGGTRDVFVMNPDGSGETNLTNHPEDDYQLRWSPEGSRIAFVSTRPSGIEQIWLMNSNGGNLKQLTFKGSSVLPAWSPDGAYLAFVRTPTLGSDDLDIWRMDASGANQVMLTTLGQNVFPSWRGMN